MLAVSGGIDSMALLHAAAHRLDAGRMGCVVVATFDHGTGDAATRAAALVRRVAEGYGLECVLGRSTVAARGEAAWRDARWRFLRRLATERRASVMTAHTRDDQVETIVMRLLRGAGARGLSGLRAPSPVLRPMLAISRAEIAWYASGVGLEWIDDPSNADRAYLRNRVRLDLLPALRSVSPTLECELLRLAEQAAALRVECANVVREVVTDARPGRVLARTVTDASWGDAEAALFCQTLAEFGGVALDWRGTVRLARFARDGRPGRGIPLSGGWEAIHRRDAIELRRRAETPPECAILRSDMETKFGSWLFRPVSGVVSSDTLLSVPIASRDAGSAASDLDTDPWRTWLPADADLEVRSWRDGDRMTSSGSGLRRVKRFLSDSRVAAADREGWPVVVADGEIVWIPGVRRAHAAPARSGRPRVCVICERLYR
ncbi:MAG: tRNA lysidine(34) synthetase TilS [Gemmatimonadota bacterium]